MTDRFFNNSGFGEDMGFDFGGRPSGRLAAEDIHEFFREIAAATGEAIIQTMKQARRACPTGGCWNPPQGLPTLEEAEEVLHLSRKQRVWWNVSRGLRLPLNRTLADAFKDRPYYSTGYWGNVPVPVGTSPHALQDWAWKVWRRASTILHPYRWSPSWEALEAAIVSHGLRRVGRVAVQVAAASLPKSVGGGLFSASRRGSNCASRLPGLKAARGVLVGARGWKDRPRTKEEGAAVFSYFPNGPRTTVKEALLEVQAVISQDTGGPTCRILGRPIYKLGPVEVRRVYLNSGYCGYPVPDYCETPYGAVTVIKIGAKVVATEDSWLHRHTIRQNIRRAIRSYRSQEGQ